MYILRWNDVVTAGATVAGGKGWNLARLHRYGFPVPPGGVVSSQAYTEFIRAGELVDLVEAAGDITLESVSTAVSGELLECLREAILSAVLPVELSQELHAFLTETGLAVAPVAVRSSATAEDSASASFAGIHRTFLDVAGLPAVTEAIKGCYASLWTPQAVAYRRRLGLSDADVSAAVVIMAMVPARSAGVAFTCDPRTGRRDRFTISAGVGLGEAVVSGTVTPDEYAVDITQYPPVVVSKTGGVLSDSEIRDLGLLSGRVMDALGELERPQDVEWAHDGRQFWLLQARPVTNLPEPSFAATAGQPVIWSNANLKDVMPGVQSALTWSMMKSGLQYLLLSTLRAGGYREGQEINWVRLFQGRPYFNLSALQWAFYDMAGMEPAEFNRILGGHQPEIVIPPSTAAERVRRQIGRLRLIPAALAAMRAAPREIKRLWDWAEAAERRGYGSAANADLLAWALEVKALTEGFFPRFQLINGASGASQQELFKLLEPVFGDRAVGLVNTMLAGASGTTSAEQGERLVALGNDALADERVRSWFLASEWKPSQWAFDLAGTRFAKDFASFLADFGHRGVYELELMNPRWREDPAYLLETVRSQVAAGKRVELQDRRGKREAAVREVFGKLRFSPRGVQARILAAQAARSAHLREMSKSVLVKVLGVTRLIALEAGRRLTADGLLAEAADVFHLSWVDLESFLAGRPTTADFRTLVADRKALRAEHLRQEPPDVILGDTPVRRNPVPVLGGAALAGLGVASGRACGPARIIRHPSEGTRLQPGDVLVAPSTDPAWTPLFLRASAIVMEVGGYLSHGAIVAREYGLPAVVNVAGALSAIADGEMITVDGDAGKVHRSGAD